MSKKITFDIVDTKEEFGFVIGKTYALQDFEGVWYYLDFETKKALPYEVVFPNEKKLN